MPDREQTNAVRVAFVAPFLFVCLACGGHTSTVSDGGSRDSGTEAGSDSGTHTGSDSGTSGCALSENTTPTGTVNNGCALLSRDTSSCQASRAAAGLSGFWLKFSCRVSLATASGGSQVQLSSDGQPDYPSNYFPTTSPCHDDYTPAFADPNQIAVTNMVMTVPMTPAGSSQAMGLGPVGMAVNGVAIFDNQAAPGDDIYNESGSFDRCQGHPQMRGIYHYHAEPYAISYDDDNLVGVMRDGNPLYGRLDPDGSTPTLDASGGHMGVTVDSPSTPVYHYHVNQQTSTNAGTAGQQVWFLTTGQYANAPGTCTGC